MLTRHISLLPFHVVQASRSQSIKTRDVVLTMTVMLFSIKKIRECVRVYKRNSPGRSGLGHVQEVHHELGESCSEGIDGGLGFILFVLADTEDTVE